jgi:hypothetical protein
VLNFFLLFGSVSSFGVVMLSFDASRCALEGMLDSIRAEDAVEGRGMWPEGAESQEDSSVPLPLRPTSRTRVPSSVRAKKALGASLDSLALPCKGSAALLKENIAIESPIANLMLIADPAPKCLSRPFDLASEPGCFPLAAREVATNNGSVAFPQFVTSPSVIPAASTPAKGREPGPDGITAQLHMSEAVACDERIDASGEQPSFSFLTAQEPPLPLTPAPHALQNSALPSTTPSSGKKWKDDGTLRLKKVHLSPCSQVLLNPPTQSSLFCIASREKECKHVHLTATADGYVAAVSCA